MLFLRPASAIASALLLAACSRAHSQDLEPRSYSNSPVGLKFLVAGYGHASGSVSVDPSLPIENPRITTDVGLLAWATTLNVNGQSAKFDIVLPFASLLGEGLVAGVRRERDITGLGDPAFRFSVNFIGAPALTAAEFPNYRQDLIFGASLRVGVPLGQYDDTRLVNIGSHRWSFKQELGISKAIGRWTLELAPAVTLYTTNNDFFGGKKREQSAMFAVQGNASYTIARSCWVAFNATYFNGARSTIDAVENDDRSTGTRFGITLALPVNRQHSLKLYGTTGFNSDGNHDINAFGIAWQYRWGGGF